MSNLDYVVFVHRYYDNGRIKPGGLDYVIDFLVRNDKKVLIVESPLYPKIHKEIMVSIVDQHERKLLLQFKTPFYKEAFTWITGILIDIYMAIRYNSRHAIVLTSDPLTSFPAVILRRLGYFSFHYFHCTDYSEVRFKNKFSDYIYRSLRALCVKNADLVGCVSMKIYNKLLDIDHKKLFYIPNSPEYQSYEKYRLSIENRNKHQIVLTCLGIAKRYKIEETLLLFEELYKLNTQLELLIIGSIDIDKKYYHDVMNLLEKMSCKTNVKFTGYITREENCKLIGESYIGICFYDETDSFSRYADSLKIREYAAMGIPCVADLVTSTAEEMQNNSAGLAVTTIPEAKEKILQLFADTALYTNMSQHALKWAEDMDKEKILKQLIFNTIEVSK
jgi:glycosyltransferase involved in cell wall biosynthesis